MWTGKSSPHLSSDGLFVGRLGWFNIGPIAFTRLLWDFAQDSELSMDFFPCFFWGYKSRRAKRVGKSGKWPSSQPLAQRHVGVRNIRRTGLMKRGAAFDAYIITYIYIYTRVYIDRDVHINVYIWFITSSLGSFRNVLGFQLVCLKSWDACQCTT